MSDFSEMAAAGAAMVIADLGETLTIKTESAIAYDDAGLSTVTWTAGTSVNGVWQPVSGATMRAEVGREVKSTAQVMLPSNATIAEGDRIYRADGTWKYVNYVMRWPGHLLALLRDTAGNQ